MLTNLAISQFGYNKAATSCKFNHLNTTLFYLLPRNEVGHGWGYKYDADTGVFIGVLFVFQEKIPYSVKVI